MEEPRPTVRPREPLDVVGDVTAMRKAMKGAGTDEDALINLLAGCTNSQRQILHKQYDSVIKRDLIKDLKSELSFHFEEVILAMTTPYYEYLAMELQKALQKKRTRVIVEILCSMETEGVRALTAAFTTVTKGQHLTDALAAATKGVFKNVLLTIVKEERVKSFDPYLSSIIALKLHNDGRGMDEEELVKLLATYSFKQLREIFAEYHKLTAKSLGDTFDDKYKGELDDAMEAIFECIQNPYLFFAESLYNSMKGAGTRDPDLIRLVVSRSEVDLGNIKDCYHITYKRSLEQDIKGDTSGHYKKVLLALIA